MTRKLGERQENNFTKGLITEATPLRFPENAATETWNCIFKTNGSVVRRLGLDYEATSADHTAVTWEDNEVLTEYLWEGAGGAGNKNLYVQQVGNILHFFDVSSTTTIEPNKTAFTADLDTYIPAGSSKDPAKNQCQYAISRGDLIVTNPAIDPIVVAYDGTTISVAEIILKERDFVGVTSESSLGVTGRPTSTLANMNTNLPNHYYNLLNQGWFTLALSQWDTSLTTMPSNADYVQLYRGSDSTPYSNTVLYNTPTTPAGKGHFVINVFSPDRDSLPDHSISGTVTETAEQARSTFERPSTCAFFSGRAWYSGIEYASLSDTVFFSQIIKSSDDYGLCYQANDPTSEKISDLLENDGGFIRIPEAAAIRKLFPFRAAMLVFATNGVWVIRGGQDGFTSTAYRVQKISSIGTRSPLSIVSASGTPFWWSEQGISTLKYDANYDSYEVVHLSLNTIQSFVDDITLDNHRYVKGTHHPSDNTIYWCYNADASVTTETNYRYNRVLCFNVSLQAFYPWSFSDGTGSRYIRGIRVLDDASYANAALLKFIVTDEPVGAAQELYFYELTGINHLDWGTDGYSSYFISGFKIDGQGVREIQAPWLFMYLDQETGASAYVSAIWDFTNTPASGRWSARQQLYNSNMTNREVNYRRLKIRGKGKSLQFKVSSDTGSDAYSEGPFTLYGWAVVESVENNA